MIPTSRRGEFAGFAILVAASLFATWACFRQLGGYDLSPLIDLFWRMRAGEHPGADFISTWPPLLLIIAKLFAPTDFGWYTLTLANIAVTLLSYAGVVLLTPRDRRRTGWCTTVAMILAIPLVYTNHIWHSSLSQLCAILFFFALYTALEGSSPPRIIGVAITAALAAMAKQNVALPLLAGTLPLVMSVGGKHRWRLTVAIGVGVAAGIVTSLCLLGMSLETFTTSYTAVVGRGRPSDEMMRALWAIPSNAPAVILTLITLLLSAWLGRPRGWPVPARLWLAALVAGISLLPIITDWDSKLNDVSLPLFIAATLVRYSGDEYAPSGWWTDLFSSLIGLVLCLALAGGGARERTYSVGLHLFWEPNPRYVIHHGYFKYMLAGDQLAKVLAEINAIKQADPSARLFFGPRIEFGYAVTKTSSPHGLPLWWHPGSSYAINDEVRIIRAFAANRFDTLIFIAGDRARMPAALLAFITRNYVIVPSTGALDVYHPKRVILSPCAASSSMPNCRQARSPEEIINQDL